MPLSPAGKRYYDAAAQSIVNNERLVVHGWHRVCRGHMLCTTVSLHVLYATRYL